MDLFKQNKFIGWVIAVLVLLNIVTISVIWMQRKDYKPDQAQNQAADRPGSEKLIQREIGMSNEQVNSFVEMRKELQEKQRNANDKLDSVKLNLCDEIFRPVLAQKIIDSLLGEIASYEMMVQRMRFEHFRSLEQICNSEQKEKLHSLLRELYGKKPPKAVSDKPREGREDQPNTRKDSGKDQNGIQKKINSSEPPLPNEDKLNRYAERLSFTPEQKKEAAKILSNSRMKGDELRLKLRRDDPDFETQKLKIRDEEDKNIMHILSSEQKKEFEKMINNRGRK